MTAAIRRDLAGAVRQHVAAAVPDEVDGASAGTVDLDAEESELGLWRADFAAAALAERGEAIAAIVGLVDVEGPLGVGGCRGDAGSGDNEDGG